jgi:membrane associated rhomboid family serine protease
VFPFHDENATLRPAIVAGVFIALCVATWILVQGAGSEYPLAASVCNLGLIPGELTGTVPAGFSIPLSEELACVIDPGPQWIHIFTSMFLHGSWMHLIGNMWFLWLFGNNVEDAMTRPRFFAFYLLCGIAAAMLQVVAEPSSPVPMVGASGAISGVMGAYLVLFPRVRVFCLVTLGFYWTTIAVPAWAMLIYWAAIQFFGGLSRVGGEGGGVAFWAHVGGFVAGIVLVKLFARRDRVVAHEMQHYRPERVGWR